MLKDLIKVANRLDSLGLTKEADYLDSIIRKMAAVSRAVAPFVNKYKIVDAVNKMIENHKKEIEMARKVGDNYGRYSYRHDAIKYLEKFLEKAGERVYVTKMPGQYFYQIWLEDPLDPASKADPRKEGDGMSVQLMPEDFKAALTEDRDGIKDTGHFDYIERPAAMAGADLAKIKSEGYGEWQYQGDIHNLGNYIDTSKLV